MLPVVLVQYSGSDDSVLTLLKTCLLGHLISFQTFNSDKQINKQAVQQNLGNMSRLSHLLCRVTFGFYHVNTELVLDACS